jgi:hypothetical protein
MDWIPNLMSFIGSDKITDLIPKKKETSFGYSKTSKYDF